jgi:hypothetical protein
VTVLAEEENGLVAKVAGRLHLIQADAATAAPEKRRAYLSEEISRSFKGMAPASRKRCLEALLERLPVGGKIAVSAPVQETAPAPEPVNEPPTQILERFMSAAANLPEEQRSEMARRLYEAGFAWMDRDALELEISDELRQKFGIQKGPQVRLSRVVELAVLLVRVLYELDRAALMALKEIYPKSSRLKRSHDFRHLAGQFLTNKSESIESDARDISALLGAMLAAMLGGGRDFGRQFLEKYSPAAIEDVIMGEGRSRLIIGPSKRERCWDKYSNLSKDIATPNLIDRWVKDCFGRFIDTGIKGD